SASGCAPDGGVRRPLNRRHEDAISAELGARRRGPGAGEGRPADGSLTLRDVRRLRLRISVQGWTPLYTPSGGRPSRLQGKTPRGLEGGTAGRWRDQGQVVGDLSGPSVECVGGTGQHLQSKRAGGRGAVYGGEGLRARGTGCPVSADYR